MKIPGGIIVMAQDETFEPIQPQWHREIARLVCEYDAALRDGGLYQTYVGNPAALIEQFHQTLLYAYEEAIRKSLDPPMLLRQAAE